MIDLNKAFETDEGIIVNDVIVPSSIFEKINSHRAFYTGNNVSQVTYYNSLSQINANRIAQVSYTYTSDKVTQYLVTYYGPDGTTPYNTETHDVFYNGDDFLREEVS